MKNRLNILKRILLSSFCTLGLLYPAVFVVASDFNEPVIDGNGSEWANVSGYAVDTEGYGQACVNEVKYAYSADGQTLYMYFHGTTPGKAYTDFLQYNIIATRNGDQRTMPVGQFQYYPAGCSVKYTNNASNWSVPGDYELEASFPVSVFGGDNFTLALQGKSGVSETVSSEDILCFNEFKPADDPEDPDDEDPSVYEGIVIDGSFADWNAIAKTDADCPNNSHKNCISAVASVFDGDYLYLYVRDGKGAIASTAGTHSNGMFSIVTDLGRNMVIQLNRDGSVSGYDGIDCRHYGNEWEIAIPKSVLPQYESTLSFGLYQSQPFITGITNMKDDSGNVGSFSGIVYDGLFGDWDDYPHTLIQYATAGTQEVIADGEQAIYHADGKIYGHVESAMIRHKVSNGSEMCSAIELRLNGNNDSIFYPRLCVVDEAGNINWNPDFYSMKPGKKYEFYIADMNDWNNASNINDIGMAAEHSKMYGKMIISVGGESKADECEYYLDSKMIADKFGLDETELKLVESKFGRIGYDWASTAGTSSGPIIGIALCLILVGAVKYYNKKKKEKLEVLA